MSGRKRTLREARRRRRLGPNARCTRCGATELAALTPGPDGLLCYECNATEHGRAPVEWHHFIGRVLDLEMVVGMPGNVHRALDDLKGCWPEEVRKNPKRNPLLIIVGYVAAVRDVAVVLAKVCQAIIDWLLRLNVVLKRCHGDSWWSKLGLPSLWKIAEDQSSVEEEDHA